MAWCNSCPSFYYCPFPHGGCYKGHPYRTQFQTVNVSHQNEHCNSNPSSGLMHSAQNLTNNMQDSLSACGAMMKQSSELSCDAYKLGKKFAKFTQHFAKFSCEASKFMGNIAYPDFESIINPKPVFDDDQVWENMNQDFERHVGKQEFLMIPEKCKIQCLKGRTLDC